MEMSLLVSGDRSVSLHVCAAVFVYVSWGRVPGSDGPAVEVLAETFPRTAPFHRLGCVDLTAPRDWLPWNVAAGSRRLNARAL